VGLHGLQNLQESARPIFVSLQISHHISAEITLQINGLRIFQGGLSGYETGAALIWFIWLRDR
jgi:hypothetical protein